MGDAGRVSAWDKTGHHARARFTLACQVHCAAWSERVDEVPGKARHLVAQQKLLSDEPFHSPVESFPAALHAGKLHQLEQLSVRHIPGMEHLFQ